MKKLLLAIFAITIANSSFSQFIGIGTSTPYSRLHIIGNEVSVPLRIQNTLNSGYAGLHFHSLTGELMGHVGYANPGTDYQPNTVYVGSIGNVPLIFTGAGIERMRINHTGEVGIGTLTPNIKAILDLTSSTKGLLIPRLTTAQRNAIVSPPKGLIVYDSTAHVIYYHNGGTWQGISSSANTWGLAGNSGTISSHFIGTTDNNMLRIKVNNIKAGLFDHINKNLSLGNWAGFNLSGSENTIIGDSAFYTDNQYIVGNTVMGYGAHSQTSESVQYNTVMGWNAGKNNTGWWTTIFGTEAGKKNKAWGNVFIGSAAGLENTTGYGNTFVGDNAGRTDSTGSGNSIFGSFAGSSSNGGDNSFFGKYTGYFNTAGSYNAAFGSQSMYSNTTGSGNTAFGAYSLQQNSTGYSNVAIGTRALYNNTIHHNLVAIGDSALFNNGNSINPADGINNTAVGSKTLYANTAGAGNSALGYNALKANTLGWNNVALGSDALLTNTTGIYNTSAGFRSLYLNNSTGYNAAFGSWSLYSNTGNNNTAMGYYAMVSNISGSNNSGLGYNVNTITGNLNNATAIGSGALVGASNAVILGDTTLGTTVGIGTAYPTKAGLVVNQTVGGYVHAMFGSNTTGVAIESNYPGIGLNCYYNGGRKFIANGYAGNINLDPFNGTLYMMVNGTGAANSLTPYVKGVIFQDGAGTSGSFHPYANNAYSLGTGASRWTTVFATNGVINTSDAREKKNIQPIKYGLSEVMRLLPVSFQWKQKDAGIQTMLGLLAQDVQNVLPEIVVENDELLGMRSMELVPVMIKAIQEQQQLITALQKKLDLLEKQNKLLKSCK